jgi:hypothetical protein
VKTGTNPFKAYLSQQLANTIGLLEGLLTWLETGTADAEAKLSRTLRAQAASDPEDLTRRITWIIGLRWGVVPVIPLLIWLLSRQHGLVNEVSNEGLTSLLPNLLLTGFSLILNMVYSVMVRQRKSLKALAYSQIILDTVIFSLTIYSTGGVASPFTFVYFLPILTATLLISFVAGLACAASASLLYVSILLLQHSQMLPVKAVFQPLVELSRGGSGYALLMGTVSVYAFFLVAVLSGLLSQVLQKREQELRLSNHTLNQRVGELSLLFDVAAITNKTTALDGVLKAILNLLVERLEFDRALLYLVTPDGKALKLKLLSRHPRYKQYPPESFTVTMPLKKTAGLTARAAVERRLYNITDPQNSPYINQELARKIGLNPFAVAPLLARGRLVGVIGVDHKYRGGPISEAEARSLVIFANQAAQTIENARLVRGGKV